MNPRVFTKQVISELKILLVVVALIVVASIVLFGPAVYVAKAGQKTITKITKARVKLMTENSILRQQVKKLKEKVVVLEKPKSVFDESFYLYLLKTRDIKTYSLIQLLKDRPDKEYLLALIMVETQFRNVKHKNENGTVDYGYFQINEVLVKAYNKVHPRRQIKTPELLNNIRYQVRIASWYLSILRKRFKTDLQIFIHYNVGIWGKEGIGKSYGKRVLRVYKKLSE